MNQRSCENPTRTQVLLALALATLLFSFFAPAAEAQVAPSAFAERNSIWVGAEYSNIHASFPYQSNQRLSGVGAFADFNWRGRFGVEADYRILHYGGFYGSTESSLLAGPRALAPVWRHFQFYGKGLLGEGSIHYPFGIGDASYFAIAPGAGVNYRMSRRWILRGEYEYQFWINSPGFQNAPDHPLTPNGFHLGLAFRPFS